MAYGYFLVDVWKQSVAMWQLAKDHLNKCKLKTMHCLSFSLDPEFTLKYEEDLLWSNDLPQTSTVSWLEN